MHQRCGATPITPQFLASPPLPCTHPHPLHVSHIAQVILVTMQFSRLHYTVTVGRGKKKDTKRILAGVSGRCLPGQLLAVMGPTGGSVGGLAGGWVGAWVAGWPGEGASGWLAGWLLSPAARWRSC